MIYDANGPDGSVKLPGPIKIRIDRDADAPADGLKGVFPLPERCGMLTELTVKQDNGAVVFSGIVDEQEQNITERTLTLAARSRAALLLDNEAMPQNYVNPSLATIFSRHIQPYGFLSYTGDGSTFSGTLSVTKGMSEWSAAASFCSRFLNTAPKITDGMFDASGSAPQRELLFGHGGIGFYSGILCNRFCELYSSLYSLDADGGTYSLSSFCTDAEKLGIRRRRLLSGSADPAAVMEQAEESAFTAVLDCPGAVTAPLLAPAVISGNLFAEKAEWRVVSSRYLLDAGGEHTRVTLRRKRTCGSHSE